MSDLRRKGRVLQVLHRASDVRKAIREVFRDPADKERIAVVAFVGDGALEYLPHLKGIRVYCWPRAGGTNPYAIGAMLDAGVSVTFVDRLHAKLYWSRTGGAVIGSSNLTNNALGAGGLAEVSVRLPSGAFDPSAFIGSLHPIADFDSALRDLRNAHNRYYSRNKEFLSRRKPIPTPTFGEWFSSGASRAEWRLGWYDDDVAAPGDTIDEETSDLNYLAIAKKSSLKEGVFTLNFLVETRKRGVALSDFYWWLPGPYRKTNHRAWCKYPHLWFWTPTPPSSLLRPFKTSEPRFQKALEKVLSELGGVRWLRDHSLAPTSSFLSLLHKRYVAR